MGEHSDKALGSLRTFRIHYQQYVLPLVPFKKGDLQKLFNDAVVDEMFALSLSQRACLLFPPMGPIIEPGRQGQIDYRN